jgi:hypothetical protein
MIKTLQNTILTACIILIGAAKSFGQTTTVTVNTADTWSGYMNVFDLSMNYLWGSAWALADMKTTFSGNEVEIKPNYNAYNASDPYWANGAAGNKIMEANSFVESTSISGTTLQFDGTVISNTLAAGYTANAFIKVLDPAQGYATIVNQTAPLPTGGTFNLSAMIPSSPGLIVQYGFVILGLNANPITEVDKGSIILGAAAPLSVGLTKFDGKVVNDNAIINWQSTGNSRAANYELQRSFDGENFSTVAIVSAKANQIDYVAKDNMMVNKQSYRLLTNNIDGTKDISSAIILTKWSNDIITVAPNPVASSLQLYVANERMVNNLATIVNMQGKVVKQFVINAIYQNIDVAELPAGVYTISIKNGVLNMFIKN